MPSILTILKSGAALLALAAAGVHASNPRAPLVVADTEIVTLAVNTTSRVAAQNFISASSGTFMTVHFGSFNLAEGDKVVVRDVAGSTSYEYTGLGRGNTGLDGGFYSSRIPGNQAVVEYVPGSGSANGAFGYTVDKITRSSTDASASKVCGLGDQSRPAKCYKDDGVLPLAYTKSRAVARLLIDGGEGCTGFLIGNNGYLVTNHHCIFNDERATHTDFEFDAEGASCSDECKTWGACPGKVVATSAQLIALDETLDYALVKLKTTVDLSQYGYLQIRTSGPVQNEAIYIPGHPQFWAKRIAEYVDSGDFARVDNVGKGSDCGKYTVSYDADTQGGSSGSPVIADSDNLVVALHFCGFSDRCLNGGTDIRSVLWDWKNKGVIPDNAVLDPTAPIPDGPWIPGYSGTPAPSTVAPSPTPTTPAPTTNACRIFTTEARCL
uniref:Serine protease n=1 Tax=Globisporangium ultimum (strain ATCC 200006 / CBS 805.95 / DAOM BR144) TaxID=431595 RepID=K3WRZ0_GLOUD